MPPSSLFCPHLTYLQITVRPTCSPACDSRVYSSPEQSWKKDERHTPGSRELALWVLPPSAGLHSTDTARRVAEEHPRDTDESWLLTGTSVLIFFSTEFQQIYRFAHGKRTILKKKHSSVDLFNSFNLICIELKVTLYLLIKIPVFLKNLLPLFPILNHWLAVPPGFVAVY